MKMIGVIGNSSIGSKITRLMCRNGASHHITTTDNTFRDNCVEVATIKDTIQMSDILFLSIPLNNIKSVCDDINKYTQNGTASTKTIISTVNGVSIHNLNKWTNERHNIVRCFLSDNIMLWHPQISDFDMDVVSGVTAGQNHLWFNDEHTFNTAIDISSLQNHMYEKGLKSGLSPIELELIMTKASCRKLD